MSNLYKILSNEYIAKDTFRMTLYGDTSKIKSPGQFVNIRIGDGFEHFLRRPISICEYNQNEISIIYKILGHGTKKLSNKEPGEYLDILCPLGNGFTIKNTKEKQLIIGGGVGIPPLYDLAKGLKKSGKKFDAILGFNSKEDIFLEKEFSRLADKVYITTMDGSQGLKGNVIDLINNKQIQVNYYYACGPEKMLHELVKKGYLGQLSFEERMGCGFGACMGCSHKTIKSYKRICKDGPVLESWEVYIDE